MGSEGDSEYMGVVRPQQAFCPRSLGETEIHMKKILERSQRSLLEDLLGFLLLVEPSMLLCLARLVNFYATFPTTLVCSYWGASKYELGGTEHGGFCVP